MKRHPTSSPRAPGLLWLVCGLCIQFMACGRPPEVTLVSCPLLRQGPICELTPERKFKLLVTADPGDGIVVLQGSRQLLKSDPDPLRTDRERLLTVEAKEGVTEVSVVSLRSGFPVGRRKLMVREQKTTEWIQRAYDRWTADQQAEAEKLLREGLAGHPTLADRAMAESYLGNILKELNRMDEARDSLLRALALSREAGLVSVELTTALDLSMLLTEHFNDPVGADKVLAEREALVRQAKPEMESWLILHRARHAWLKGSASTALQSIDRGLLVAERFGTTLVKADLWMLRADVLRSLGRESEAGEAVKAALDLSLPRCWRAYVLGTTGHSLVQAREARPGGASAGTEDPRQPLREALDIVASECVQVPLATEILHDLARAELLDGHLPEATAWLQRAADLNPAPTGRIGLERRDLQGQVALLRARPVEASAQGGAAPAADLLHDAQLIYEDLPHHGPDLAADETSLRALSGSAAAWETQDPQRALGLYQQAEAYLDLRSLEMPLGAGRVGFLWQHDRVVQHHVDLLARRGLLDEALDVIRRARSRGLLVLRALDAVPGLTGPAQVAWRSHLDKIKTSRAQVDQLYLKTRLDPLDLQKSDQEKLLRLESEIAEELDSALRQVPYNPTLARFRAPAHGEALLACYPGRQDHICVLKTESGIKSVRLTAVGPRAGEAMITKRLLRDPGFAELLRGKQRLVVLPGGIQAVDLHLLQFEGRPLGQQMLVDYALDLPVPDSAIATAAQPAQALSKVLLGFDALEYQPDLPQGAELSRALGQGGFTVVRPDAPVRNATAHQPSSNRLADLLSQPAALHFLLGHAAALGAASGWSRSRLGAIDDAGVLVADVLTLVDPSSLRGAVVIECESGLADTEVPVFEGLSPAQAYLALPGQRWVIGTTRKVDSRIAIQVAAALSSQGAAALLQDPHRQLDRALAEVRDALARRKDPAGPLALAIADHDLGAYRIFTR